MDGRASHSRRWQNGRVQLIGLTGGIAAGKSTVARRLAEFGAVVIDADAIAREVVEPGEPALARIRERFGDAVIADGALDRAALGAVVFGDPEARRDLESITHPAVRDRVRVRIAEAERADPDAVVVYDVPLLVEAKLPLRFDHVIVVHAAVAERRRRLVELRGLTPIEADRRIAAQATDAERLAVADIVIDAGGTLAETIEQTDAAWRRIRSTA